MEVQKSSSVYKIRFTFSLKILFSILDVASLRRQVKTHETATFWKNRGRFYGNVARFFRQITMYWQRLRHLSIYFFFHRERNSCKMEGFGQDSAIAEHAQETQKTPSGGILRRRRYRTRNGGQPQRSKCTQSRRYVFWPSELVMT